MNTQDESQFPAEEEVAHATLQRIREWLQRIPHAEMKKESKLRGDIQFCGGCNPEVDRVEIARILREKLQGEIFFASAEEEIELLILIHGCLAACADRPEITRRAQRVLNVAGKVIGSMRINRPV